MSGINATFVRMEEQAIVHDLGRIEAVNREDAPALSRDVPLDLLVIQSASIETRAIHSN